MKMTLLRKIMMMVNRVKKNPMMRMKMWVKKLKMMKKMSGMMRKRMKIRMMEEMMRKMIDFPEICSKHQSELLT